MYPGGRKHKHFRRINKRRTRSSPNAVQHNLEPPRRLVRNRHQRRVCNGWNTYKCEYNFRHIIEGHMNRIVTYGLGGYDPSKPNGNIIEIIELPDDEPIEQLVSDKE